MEAACLRLYIKAAHKCYEGEEDYYSGVGFFYQAWRMCLAFPVTEATEYIKEYTITK